MIHNGKKTSSAFTLLEMSIVIVIIALLVGGIMVGRSLIRSSELQATLAEYTKYTQAITAFRDKYHALPGDYSDAETLWGEINATHATCIVNVSTSSALATCNGDGNGRIVTMSDYANTYYEQFRAWQHLANAQFIDGNYTGIATSALNATYGYTIGTNIPASRFSSAGWKMMTITSADPGDIPLSEISYTVGDIPPNLLLWFGGAYYEASLRMTPVMGGHDAYDLDIKIDDGLPNSGKVITQTDPESAEMCNLTGYTTYNLSEQASRCALIFKTGI